MPPCSLATNSILYFSVTLWLRGCLSLCALCISAVRKFPLPSLIINIQKGVPMDIFFADPNEVPLPPDEVRIRELKAEPWPDGRKVHIYLETDPFQRKPNADVVILNAKGEEVADASVIEPMNRKMEFTLHLREPEPGGSYQVKAVLFYTEPIPEPKEGETEPPELPEPQIVDRAETRFEVKTETG